MHEIQTATATMPAATFNKTNKKKSIEEMAKIMYHKKKNKL